MRISLEFARRECNLKQRALYRLRSSHFALYLFLSFPILDAIDRARLNKRNEAEIRVKWYVLLRSSFLDYNAIVNLEFSEKRTDFSMFNTILSPALILDFYSLHSPCKGNYPFDRLGLTYFPSILEKYSHTTARITRILFHVRTREIRRNSGIPFSDETRVANAYEERRALILAFYTIQYVSHHSLLEV